LIRSKPPADPKMAELSYQQNIFDFTYPYDIAIDFEKFIDEFVKESYPEAIEKMK
jgi:hypothetical protein